MSDYSYQDMLKMQREAKKRVLEMQKRSRDAAENFSMRGKRETHEEQSSEELPRVAKAISYPTEIGSQNQRMKQGAFSGHGKNPLDLRHALTSVFGNLSSDEYEKMFILSLCLLLSEEREDDSLIFALMYLIT